MTDRAQTPGSENEPAVPARAARLVIATGVLLLVAGMGMVVAGVIAAPLFRPGTWLILLALGVTAAGGVLRLAGRDSA